MCSQDLLPSQPWGHVLDYDTFKLGQLRSVHFTYELTKTSCIYIDTYT